MFVNCTRRAQKNKQKKQEYSLGIAGLDSFFTDLFTLFYVQVYYWHLYLYLYLYLYLSGQVGFQPFDCVWQGRLARYSYALGPLVHNPSWNDIVIIIVVNIITNIFMISSTTHCQFGKLQIHHSSLYIQKAKQLAKFIPRNCKKGAKP